MHPMPRVSSRVSTRAAVAAAVCSVAVAGMTVPAQAATFEPRDGGCVVTVDDPESTWFGPERLPEGETVLMDKQREELYSFAVSQLARLDAEVIADQAALSNAWGEEEEWEEIRTRLIFNENAQEETRKIIWGLEKCAAGETADSAENSSYGAQYLSAYGTGNLSSYIERQLPYPNGEDRVDFAYGDFKRFGIKAGAVLAAVGIAAVVGLAAAAPMLVQLLPVNIRYKVEDLLSS